MESQPADKESKAIEVWDRGYDWTIGDNEHGETERKIRATIILDNYQLLMKYALTNEQSIPATRIYFQKVAAGDSPIPIIKNWFKVST